MDHNNGTKPQTTLISLSAEYASLSAELMSLGGELSPENEMRLEVILNRLCEKTDGYGMVIDQLTQQAEFWKFQKDKCAEAQRILEGAVQKLRDRMKFVLGQTPGESMQGELYRFFLAKAAPKLVIDEEILPAQFKKTEIKQTPDRNAILCALEKGQIPEGVKLEENKSLRSGRPK